MLCRWTFLIIVTTTLAVRLTDATPFSTLSKDEDVKSVAKVSSCKRKSQTNQSFSTLYNENDSNFTTNKQEQTEVLKASVIAPTEQNFDHVQYSIRNGDLSSVGVNLGGWLVAEHWMTRTADFWQGVPSEDAGKGEFTAITKASDPDAIRLKLDQHHQTFITEGDIIEIAAAGLNTVRVPVGYWIVGFDNDDPSKEAAWSKYSNGTLKYLDALVTNWAKQHNVAVLIGIHAAKGSQNGADHSSPSDPGKSYWSAYDENIANTIATATFLADRYKDEDAFLGIGLLNEPSASTDEVKLYAYYEAAYEAIRKTGNDCILSVSPLLFKQNPDTMTDFMQAPQYTNVWVEWHPYFVWGYEHTSEVELTQTVVKVNFQKSVSQWNEREHHNRLFMGEWSFATSGKFADDLEEYYEFCQAMMDVIYQADAGFTFWSWRIYEDESEFNAWSLRSVLRDERLKAIFIL